MEFTGWATTVIIILLVLIALALWTVFCLLVSRTVSKIYYIRREQRRALHLRNSLHAAIQQAIPSISGNVATTLPFDFVSESGRTATNASLAALPTYEQVVGLGR